MKNFKERLSLFLFAFMLLNIYNDIRRVGMEKISNIDLYKAKEKCLELKKQDKRLILKGNNPILLSATLFEENTNTIDFINRVRYDFYWNSENISYLDALVMYLHEKYQVHGMIDKDIF